MNRECQQINTVSEWLDETGETQAELARMAGVNRSIVNQAKRLDHLVIINSVGKPVLVPATYREAFE